LYLFYLPQYRHDKTKEMFCNRLVQSTTESSNKDAYVDIMVYTSLRTIMAAVLMLILSSPCFAFSTPTSQYSSPRRDKYRRFYHRVTTTVSDIRLYSSTTNTDNEKSNNNILVLPPRAKLLPRVLRYRGSVDEGYGRGGKKLGIPTANLPSSLFKNALEDVMTGVYFGWAALERNDSKNNDDNEFQLYKAVVNVGFSPTFEGKENKEKIIEAHLISEKGEEEKGEKNIEKEDFADEASCIIKDFYGVSMRIQLIGFLREEKKFDSFPELIAQIHADVDDARLSLDCHPYQSCRSDTFFSSSPDSWVGNGGGDQEASWESEPIQSFLDSM